MLPIKLPSSVYTFGKPVYQIATELLGSPSNFRELFDQTGITPFDPQSKIDRLKEIPSVKDIQPKLDTLNTATLETFTQIKKAANDVVKLDWLMN